MVMNSAVFRPTSFLCMIVHILLFLPLIPCASRVLRLVCKRTCQDGGHSRPGVCFGNTDHAAEARFDTRCTQGITRELLFSLSVESV
jgi:hypothetical protein